MQAEYPFVLDVDYRLTLAGSAAVFFFAFLLVFLPFGVSNYDPRHEYTLEFLLAMASFGAVTGGVILADEFLLKPLVPGISTSRGVLLWSGWTCLLAGLANYFTYNLLGGWHDVGLLSAVTFVLNCTAVLVFPLVGTFALYRYRDLRSSFEEILDRTSSVPASDQLVALSGPGSADRLVLRLKDLLYGRAQDNYVELFYEDDGNVRTHLLRATLSGLVEENRGVGIERCHRSYLVNLGRVTSVRGSGSRLYLALDGVEEQIPISRSFRERMLAALQEHRGLTSDFAS